MKKDWVELRIGNDVEPHRRPIVDRAGLGLANTRERLNQIYGSDASVTVSEGDEKLFLVAVRLPFDTGQAKGDGSR